MTADNAVRSDPPFSADDGDIETWTTHKLLTELSTCRRMHEVETNMYAARALELRIVQIELVIARHNCRATRRLDGMSEQRLREIEREIGGDHIAHGNVVRLVGELVAEVRRLQGEVSALLPRYLPPEHLGAEPVVPPPLEMEVASPAEVLAREEQDADV